jgi:hypothetical protein
MSDDEAREVYDDGVSRRRRTGCGVKYDIVYDRHKDDARCVWMYVCMCLCGCMCGCVQLSDGNAFACEPIVCM